MPEMNFASRTMAEWLARSTNKRCHQLGFTCREEKPPEQQVHPHNERF
jgi:hypothetical protein